MNIFKNLLRFSGIYALGTLAAMVCFGLALGISWLPLFSQYMSYKLVSALLAAALSITVGACLTSWLTVNWLTQADRMLSSAAFGGLLGLFSFGYIFGPDPLVLFFLLASSLLGATGGWLASQII